MTRTFRVTRVSSDRYAVVSDIAMSDGSMLADHYMRLDGTMLRSVERRGHIRVGGLLKLNLVPASLALVTALGVGETVGLEVK